MIAVTGAAGFIGSCLAHRLADEGHKLLLVDAAVDPAKASNLADLVRFRLRRHDSFIHQLESGAIAPEAIFHLGACSSTTETDWDYLYDNNVVYSQKLWNWCAESGRPFFYASSAATYGDGKQGFGDRLTPDQLAPLNLYGRSKNDFDRWALAQVEAGKPAPPRWAGLKFFNVYGSRETHKGTMASVVWQAYRQILETGEVRLFRSTDPAYPDGGQQRDFVYVEDCIDHMIWLWENDAPNAIYNSGSGRARTFLDLVHAVFAALRDEPRIRFIDMPASLARQYQNFTQAEMSKLRSAGYDRPATSLEEGVRRTILGYQGLTRRAA